MEKIVMDITPELRTNNTIKRVAVYARVSCEKDTKLIVSKNGNDYSDDAINALTEFQERFFDSLIIKKEYRFTIN